MEKELYLVSATKHFFDRNKIVKASSLFEIGINFFPTWFYECFKTLKLYEINRPLLFFHCLVFISLMNVRYGKLKIVSERFLNNFCKICCYNLLPDSKLK